MEKRKRKRRVEKERPLEREGWKGKGERSDNIRREGNPENRGLLFQRQ